MRRLSRNQIDEFMEDGMSEVTVAAQKELNKANEELRAAQVKANAASQSLHKAYEEQEHTQATPVAHPGRVSNKIENDYRNSPGRWNGPNTSVRPAALTNEQLQALRDAAPKPLPTFAEKARAAEAKGETLKPSVTILSR
jgi:hypothetical protein